MLKFKSKMAKKIDKGEASNEEVADYLLKKLENKRFTLNDSKKLIEKNYNKKINEISLLLFHKLIGNKNYEIASQFLDFYDLKKEQIKPSCEDLLWSIIENDDQKSQEKDLLMKKIIEKFNPDVNDGYGGKLQAGSLLGFAIFRSEIELASLILEKYPDVDVRQNFIKDHSLFQTGQATQQEQILNILCQTPNKDFKKILYKLFSHNFKLDENIIQDILNLTQNTFVQRVKENNRNYAENFKEIPVFDFVDINILEILEELKKNPSLQEQKLTQNFAELDDQVFFKRVYPFMSKIREDFKEFIPTTLPGILFYKAAETDYDLAKDIFERQNSYSDPSSSPKLSNDKVEQLIDTYRQNGRDNISIAQQAGYKKETSEILNVFIKGASPFLISFGNEQNITNTTSSINEENNKP